MACCDRYVTKKEIHQKCLPCCSLMLANRQSSLWPSRQPSLHYTMTITQLPVNWIELWIGYKCIQRQTAAFHSCLPRLYLVSIVLQSDQAKCFNGSAVICVCRSRCPRQFISELRQADKQCRLRTKVQP